MKGTPDQPQCGFSRTMIQILGQQGVDPTKFAAYNVLEDPDLRDGAKAFDRNMEEANRTAGIKQYSDWPTIPQLYVDKEFVGGVDIVMSMLKDESLQTLLTDKDVLVLEDTPDGQA
jgi:monothiol glutaredoxin